MHINNNLNISDAYKLYILRGLFLSGVSKVRGVVFVWSIPNLLYILIPLRNSVKDSSPGKSSLYLHRPETSTSNISLVLKCLFKFESQNALA